jgi:hypothetical protein
MIDLRREIHKELLKVLKSIAVPSAGMALFALTACGGGSGGIGGGGGNSYTPSGGGSNGNQRSALAVSPSSLNFASPTSPAQSFVLSGGSGTITYSSSCLSANIAKTTTSSTTVPATYTVSPLGGTGTCSLTFSDSIGETAVESISVASTGGGGSISSAVLTEVSNANGEITYHAYNPNSVSVWFFWGLTKCVNVYQPLPLCDQPRYPQVLGLDPYGTGTIWIDAKDNSQAFSFEIEYRTYGVGGQYNAANPPPFP